MSELHKICPNCNSHKTSYFNRRNRGAGLVIISIVLYVLFLVYLPGIMLVATLGAATSTIKGIYWVIKGGEYYICNNCLFCFDREGNQSDIVK